MAQYTSEQQLTVYKATCICKTTGLERTAKVTQSVDRESARRTFLRVPNPHTNIPSKEQGPAGLCSWGWASGKELKKYQFGLSDSLKKALLLSHRRCASPPAPPPSARSHRGQMRNLDSVGDRCKPPGSRRDGANPRSPREGQMRTPGSSRGQVPTPSSACGPGRARPPYAGSAAP